MINHLALELNTCSDLQKTGIKTRAAWKEKNLYDFWGQRVKCNNINFVRNVPLRSLGFCIGIARNCAVIPTTLISAKTTATLASTMWYKIKMFRLWLVTICGLWERYLLIVHNTPLRRLLQTLSFATYKELKKVVNQLSDLRLHIYMALSCSPECQEKVLFLYGYIFFLLLYNQISIYPHLLMVYLLHIQHLLVSHGKTLLMQMWFHYKPHIINSYSIHCKFVRNVTNTTMSTMESDKLFMNSTKAYILCLPTIQYKLIQWRMRGCSLSPVEENCVLGHELV